MKWGEMKNNNNHEILVGFFRLFEHRHEKNPQLSLQQINFGNGLNRAIFKIFLIALLNSVTFVAFYKDSAQSNPADSSMIVHDP